MRPVETRFGRCAPHIGKAVGTLSALWGEIIVPCGGSAANRLGLTAQNPVREVYLTSGPNRRLKFGTTAVELRHAPRWQLLAPHRKAGDVIRALAWLGRRRPTDSLDAVLPALSPEDLAELAAPERSCRHGWPRRSVRVSCMAETRFSPPAGRGPPRSPEGRSGERRVSRFPAGKGCLGRGGAARPLRRSFRQGSRVQGRTSLSKAYGVIQRFSERRRHHLRHPRLRPGPGRRRRARKRCRRRAARNGAGHARSGCAWPNGCWKKPGRSSNEASRKQALRLGSAPEAEELYVSYDPCSWTTPSSVRK